MWQDVDLFNILWAEGFLLAQLQRHRDSGVGTTATGKLFEPHAGA